MFKNQRQVVCVDITLLWKTGCQHCEHVSSSKHPDEDAWHHLFIHAHPRPFFSISDLRNQPYRRADAVRRSVRRRFDDQNLRPVNNGDVVMWRGNSACARAGDGGGEGERYWGGRERERKRVRSDKKIEAEWRMTRESQVFVATCEMIMYIYYIRILNIPHLCYSISSISLWRTGTRMGLNLKCLKGWFKNLWRAKCLNFIVVVFLWFHVTLPCLPNDCS